MNKPENTSLKKPRCSFDRSSFKKCIFQPLGKRFKIGRHDATLILITTLAQVEQMRLVIDATIAINWGLFLRFFECWDTHTHKKNWSFNKTEWKWSNCAICWWKHNVIFSLNSWLLSAAYKKIKLAFSKINNWNAPSVDENAMLVFP